MWVLQQEVDDDHDDSLQERENGKESKSKRYQWAGRRDSSTSAAVAKVTASRQHQQTHTEAVQIQGQHTS